MAGMSGAGPMNGDGPVAALRVEIEALTASFRYPHFLWGGPPTYELPPPSTIYGLLCSAAGELLDPKPLRFGYTFRHEGKAVDVEHIHVMDATTARRNFRGEELPANVEGSTNPLAPCPGGRLPGSAIRPDPGPVTGPGHRDRH